VGDDVGVPTKGVLFHWRGTLVNDPDGAWWVRTALGRIERGTDDAGVTEIVDRPREARELPSVVSAQATVDCTAEQHRAATMLWFSEANLDSALAEALYALNLDPVAHPSFKTWLRHSSSWKHLASRSPSSVISISICDPSSHGLELTGW
jgi:hypothetical protein